MAKKKKKAAKKKRSTPKVPRKVTITQSRVTTIGKVKRRPRNNASYYMRQAKDQLYNELARLYVLKEKATTKMNRKKISRKITAKRQQINRLK